MIQDQLLDLLGIAVEDRPALHAWRRAAHESAAARASLAAVSGRLRDRIGHWLDPCEDPLAADDSLGAQGALAALALIDTAQDVHADHCSRGIPPEVSWATLADLGRQLVKGRRLRGHPCLTEAWWDVEIWRGGLLHLGRLQYEPTHQVIPGEEERGPQPVLSVHIPATGPLTPDEVDASFAEALRTYAVHVPEHGPLRWLVCRSWLLDPWLAVTLPGSNLAHFQQRWALSSSRPGLRDVLFFAFDVEHDSQRPLAEQLDGIPADSTLRRSLAAHLRAGGEIGSWSGAIRVSELA